jgi:hypothetical protein
MTWHLINLSFDPVHELDEQFDIRNELVIEKFHRQAALEVRNHWNAKEQAGNLADDNTFMKVGMDDVRPEPSANPNYFPQQEKVDIELVERRASRQFLVPRDE